MTEQAARPDLTRSRRALFFAVAWAIPIAIFVLAEVALRLTGVAAQEPLFIAAPDQRGLQLPNPDVIRRYFAAGRAPSLRIETGYFRAERPPGGLRIVVQGGSSAAGFPYGYGASLTGMLEQRLRRGWPHRDIEVINTAMSAVNSYTLLDFADEIVAIEPDAVLIYAGHNEYLGIFGVGSALLGGRSPALTRAYLALRDLHLFRLLETAYQSVAGAPDAPAEADPAGITMMSRIVADRQIAFGSSKYRAGVGQYRHNLGALVARYVRAGIPVYVGTLVGNERDLPPFVSGLADDAIRADWEARRAVVEELLTHGDASAMAAARSLLELDERSADAWFLLARALERDGDYDAARNAYQAARDRDELRFRAPGEFNAIVAEMADAGARIVDVDARLRAEAREGILGEELLLEHVHPNLRGYFLLADAFYDALVDDEIPGEPLAAAGEAQAWREVPVSEVDRVFGSYKVALIEANWPFTDTAGQPTLPDPDSVPAMLARELYAQRIDWTTAHLRLADHYRSTGNQPELLRVALILADALPFRPALLYQAGVALIGAGRSRQAIDYLYRGAQIAPRDVNLLLALGHALVLNNAREQAVPVLERVLALDPGNVTASDALRQLR